MKSPTVTIITGTLNPDLRIFERSLISVKNQASEHTVQHLVLDGGTTNGGIELAKHYGCTVIRFKSSVHEGGNRIYKALQAARGEIILFLESDNIMVGDDWISRLVKPYKNLKIFSTYPAYNDYENDMGILTRYTALIGAPDPTLYYLKKSDKILKTQKRYDKGIIISENRNYYTVKFNSLNLTTMGDNGFMIRRKVLQKVVFKNQIYFHTDAFRVLLDLGYDTYGVTKNSIIHTTKSNIINTVMRRIQVKRHFSDDLRGTRKYLVFNWHSSEDWLHIISYMFFSLTFIQPIIFAIRGYRRIPDVAWFLHPVMCFVMVVGYIISEIEYQVKNLSKKLL